MGFINLGTRVGLGTTAEPYEINYNRIRVVNCDDILLVSGSGSGGNQETLIITITYKYHIIYSTIPQVLTNDITYQTRSGYDLEFNLGEYIDLFSEVIASASNIPTAMINAPLVNEFDPNSFLPHNFNPLSGVISFGLSAGIT